jgi:hypothetical protein
MTQPEGKPEGGDVLAYSIECAHDWAEILALVYPDHSLKAAADTMASWLVLDMPLVHPGTHCKDASCNFDGRSITVLMPNAFVRLSWACRACGYAAAPAKQPSQSRERTALY